MREKENSRQGRILIRGIQRLDGQEDVNEIRTTAKYIKKEEKRYLFYKEYLEGGESWQVRLTIDEKEVTQKKTGNGISVLRFRKGASMPCQYQSVMGPMDLISRTRKIRLREKECELSLKMEYSLYMNEIPMSDYELQIEWTENK